MTRHCTVEQRDRATDIADQLRVQPTVAAVDVLEPTEGPRDEWSIEVIVGRRHLPAQTMLALGAHGLQVETVQTRAVSGTTQVVATIPE